MKIRHFCALIALSAGCLLVGCHSDVDLNNIDTTANVEMGLAVPVGSMTFTVGDFLGSGQVSQISVDVNGTFHFADTLSIPQRVYHKIDLSSYQIKNPALDLKIKDLISSDVLPAATLSSLRFEVELGLAGINENPKLERIDSIQVTQALFTSLIKCEDLGLQWSDIAGVILELGDQFRPWNGNKFVSLPIEGRAFNENIEVSVNNFTLNLLKNAKDPDEGTVDKVKLYIIINVLPSHDIAINSNSKFLCDMDVKVNDFDAMWGFFESGDQMHDKDVVEMKEVWEGWKDFRDLELNIAEPTINVHLTHKIAAPLFMSINYLRVTNDQGENAAASWEKDGKKTESDAFSIDKAVLSPESPLTDGVEVLYTFSNKPEQGHIDQLFGIKPDIFEYSYDVQVDQTEHSKEYYPYKQHRLAKDNTINGYAVIDVPFKFGENFNLAYSSTIDSVPFLNSISLDSILAKAKVLNDINASNIKLILDVENTIPFAIDGKFYFLGENDKEMDLQFIQDSTLNHVHFDAPEMSEPKEGETYGEVIAPSKTRIVVNVEKSDFEELSKVKKLRFDASLVNNPPKPCHLDKSAGLKVRIGLSAQADVVLNFDDEKK